MRSRLLYGGAVLFSVMVACLTISAPATAAKPPEPIEIGLPGGPGLQLERDLSKIRLNTGTSGTPLNEIEDFEFDAGFFRCGSSLSSDGSIWCGLGAAPSPPPVVVPPSPPIEVPELPPLPTLNPRDVPEPSLQGAEIVTGLDAPAVPGPVSENPEAEPPEVPLAVASPRKAETSDLPARWDPAAHIDQVLNVGVGAFALLALVGSGGLAAGKGKSVPGSKKQEGELLFAEFETHEFNADSGGRGDRSRVWRILAGWWLLDRFSQRVPVTMARRAPLTARVLTDGAYLRAIFGSIWILAPIAGLTLGVLAARDTGGYALPPTIGLVAALLVLAVFDATAGFLGVVAFGLALLLSPASGLGLAPTLRSFFGLAAIWFAIPLVASVARPFRRNVGSALRYRWDRLGDGVIAALAGGWAVKIAAEGLPGLTGRDIPIADHANRLAMLTIGAIALRVVLEEVAARHFPERLKVVESGPLPEPSTLRSWVSAVLRTVVFVFVAYAFVGNCWQLWVGTAMFAVPALLDVRSDSLPNSERLYRLIPQGIALLLVVLVVEGLFVMAVDSMHTQADAILRYGFVLIALPGFLVSIASLFGREGTDPEPSWRREIAGVAVLSALTMLVIAGW